MCIGHSIRQTNGSRFFFGPRFEVVDAWNELCVICMSAIRRIDQPNRQHKEFPLHSVFRICGGELKRAVCFNFFFSVFVEKANPQNRSGSNDKFFFPSISCSGLHENGKRNIPKRAKQFSCNAMTPEKTRIALRIVQYYRHFLWRRSHRCADAYHTIG